MATTMAINQGKGTKNSGTMPWKSYQKPQQAIENRLEKYFIGIRPNHCISQQELQEYTKEQRVQQNDMNVGVTRFITRRFK